ncbi:phage holin family protein [Alkaliflexus imshenetskii]|uniref:phage holin family protein n=1 Tax=Alkaliflexus imshenetskii TaxID=286730 RepID=UPI0004B367F2|nr:phage holin family protein [Alkaliflexus imshenetskii]
MIQDNIKENLAEVKDEFEKYLDKRIDLTKIHVVEELSKFTSGFAVKLGVLYLLFFVLMFLSLATAFFLSDLLNSNGLGFTIVALFYLILAIVFYAMRHKWVEKPIIKAFIKLFFPKFEEDEE